MAFDPTDLLKKLIACPSVTPLEAGALDLIEELLTQHGFVCQRLVFGTTSRAVGGTPEQGVKQSRAVGGTSEPDPEIKVDNLFARFGEESPHLCFAGHSDVVPPGPLSDWTYPPFSATIADGYLYGRGACDMKGPLAACLSATLNYLDKHKSGIRGSISFLITGDEEGPALNGTVKVLEWMRQHSGRGDPGAKYQSGRGDPGAGHQSHIPDHALVIEPTSDERLGDMIKIGRRGSMSFTVTVKGKQGHVAYAHKADNPIDKLVRFLDRLNTSPLDGGHALFEASTLSITDIKIGNDASNIIPGQAQARFNIRFNPNHNFASLRAWVDCHVEAVQNQMGGEFTIAVSENAEAFITNPSTFVESVKNAIYKITSTEAKLSTTGGTSDARFIKNYCPVIEFGPLNATIHQVNERIALSDLTMIMAIYEQILYDYFSLERDQPRSGE